MTTALVAVPNRSPEQARSSISFTLYSDFIFGNSAASHASSVFPSPSCAEKQAGCNYKRADGNFHFVIVSGRHHGYY